MYEFVNYIPLAKWVTVWPGFRYFYNNSNDATFSDNYFFKYVFNMRPPENRYYHLQTEAFNKPEIKEKEPEELIPTESTADNGQKPDPKKKDLNLLQQADNKEVNSTIHDSKNLEIDANVKKSVGIANEKVIDKSALSKTVDLKDDLLSQIEMIYVPEGICSTEQWVEKGYITSKEKCEIPIKPFYLGKFEVTQGLWYSVMGNNPSDQKGDLSLPVENISWDECQEFLEMLYIKTGVKYRLPTSIEWEYAAEYGYKKISIDEINLQSWNDSNSRSKTHKVGGKNPNKLGFHDMLGNVREWCMDLEKNSHDMFRVISGGSITKYAEYCDPNYKERGSPDDKVRSTGLRLALDKLEN
jgi:formylglycine-generating enzyme required for sulfatase activity